MPSSSFSAGMPSSLSLVIAASLSKPSVGIPGYEVSGECGAVGPWAANAPKKSYVIGLYQSRYCAAPA